MALALAWDWETQTVRTRLWTDGDPRSVAPPHPSLSPPQSLKNTSPLFSPQTPVSVPSFLPQAAPLGSGQVFSAPAGGTVFPPSHGHLLYR